MPQTAGLPTHHPHVPICLNIQSTVASKQTLVDFLMIPFRTYILLIIIWNTLLPTSLFQSYLAAGFSFVWTIATVLTAAGAEALVRIGFLQQKERVALMFCQRSSPLRFRLAACQLWLHVFVNIFAYVLTRHFSDVEFASCRLQCEGCSAFSFLQSPLSLYTAVGERKTKEWGSLLGSSFPIWTGGKSRSQHEIEKKFTGLDLCIL